MITGEQKEITIGGLTSTANDYDSSDGDLMVAHNLVNDGSGLKGIVNPEEVITFNCHTWGASFTKFAYVHHASTVNVYIAIDANGNAVYCKEGGSQMRSISELAGLFTADKYTIGSVGNTLVVNIVDKGLYYILWKNSKQSASDADELIGYYKYIGQTPPDIGLEFQLKLKVGFLSEGIDVDRSGTTSLTIEVDCSDAEIPSGEEWSVYYAVASSNNLFDSLMAAQNEVVAEAKKKTAFTHPFFVRYAYRMYDGNFCNVSAPVYMLPCDGYNPIYKAMYEGSEKIKYGYSYYRTYLQARIPNAYYSQLDILSDWEDIIQSVCVFVTPMILNYSETGDKLRIYGGALFDKEKEPLTMGHGVYAYIANSTKHDNTERLNDIIGYRLAPFERTEGAMEDWIEQAYNFYLLREFTLEELNDYLYLWADISRDGGTTNLEDFEQLPNGYETRSIKSASVLHTYNGRLNLANVKAMEKETFPIGDFSCYSANTDDNGHTISVSVYIEENGQYQIATANTPSSEDWTGDLGNLPGYFFYPNANAKYAVITSCTDGEARNTYYLKLTQHPFLNGAYCYDPFFSTLLANGTTEPSEMSYWEHVAAFERHNYIYTSEVDNPFIFSESGVNAIGSGSVVTIKTSTKATSEGTAFGTQPLYAFCTDGIWALEVGDTGVYAAKQPVSRETLLNDKDYAALAVDNSVIFLSDRGLMSLVGGSTSLLSTPLTGRTQTINATDLPKWTDIMKTFNGGSLLSYKEADDFLTFIKGARLAFDYVNSRCIIYRTDKKLAYVYDATSELWSTMDCEWASSVEDYPGTLVSRTVENTTTNKASLIVEKFTANGEDGFIGDGKGFYVTRPMKLESPDVMKTIRRLIERNINIGSTTKYLALYGSRDLVNWALIAAVKGHSIPRISGTPYRFFIVAGFTEITHKADVVSRLTMERAKKYMDRIR